MCFQVDTDPIPNIIVDVRKPDEVAYNPLPQALMGGVNIPGEEPAISCNAFHICTLFVLPFLTCLTCSTPKLLCASAFLVCTQR